MRLRYPLILMAVVCPSLLLAQVRAALGQEVSCTSRSDAAYTVKSGETLSSIASRLYCEGTEPNLNRVWRALYEHNVTVAGPDPATVPVGTILCLPDRFDGPGWKVERCYQKSEEATPKAPEPPRAAMCGDNRREGGEVCDGADLGKMTCEALGQPPGKLSCRADCAAFDAGGCGSSPEVKVKGAPVPVPAALPMEKDKGPAKRWLRRFYVDATTGVLVPFSGETRAHMFPVASMTELSGRLSMDEVELSAAVVFLASGGGTLFNDSMAQQRVLGGGLSAKVGYQFSRGALRVTPGLEVGSMYLKRSIERSDFPFAPAMEEQGGLLGFAGVFVRPEYVVSRRLRVELGLGSDVLLGEVAGLGFSKFNAKLLGGVGYAF